jgi:hypothetical protein
MQRVVLRNLCSSRNARLSLFADSFGSDQNSTRNHTTTSIRATRRGIFKRLGFIGEVVGAAKLFLENPRTISASNRLQKRRAEGRDPIYPLKSLRSSRPNSNPSAMRDPMTAPHVSPRRAIPGNGVNALRIWSPSRSNSSCSRTNEV